MSRELLIFLKKYLDMYDESKCLGIYGVGVHSKNIHLSEETFFDNFEKFAIEERDCKEYPYEYYAEDLGVRFFCISKEEK